MNDSIDKISQDLVSSLKAKDEVTTSTLRLLLSEIKNAQIAKGEELSGEEVVDVIGKSAKKRKESIEAYQKGGRSDLVEKEQAELKVLEKYMLEQMGEEEINRIVDKVVSKSGARNTADIGKVMRQIMGKLKGRADGGVVSEIVKKKLAS